ncbi:MAG: hypothetical protein IT440_03800 [Phycisphaeraceae bacterium]|nr:hypothetical protein [Phycisphaeraceae bacterium]
MTRPIATPEPRAFAPTRWSLVLAAANWRQGSDARRAFGELAQTYWFPLYAFLRRAGCMPQQAEDLVQGFFTRMLDKDALTQTDRNKGKFRTFLLASLKHFVANERDRGLAAKRGGKVVVELLDAEARYVREPADTMTPDRVYERRWALTVLEQVLSRLREEYIQRGQGDLFAALQPALAGDRRAGHAAVAAQLSTTEGAVKVAAHRLRRRYRELLRDEIAQTVDPPDSVEDELQYLRKCL